MSCKNFVELDLILLRSFLSHSVLFANFLDRLINIVIKRLMNHLTIKSFRFDIILFITIFCRTIKKSSVVALNPAELQQIQIFNA